MDELEEVKDIQDVTKDGTTVRVVTFTFGTVQAGFIKDGKRHGQWKSQKPTGDGDEQLEVWRGKYHMDRKHGDWTYSNTSDPGRGQVAVSGQYEDGKPVGKWSYHWGDDVLEHVIFRSDGSIDPCVSKPLRIPEVIPEHEIYDYQPLCHPGITLLWLFCGKVPELEIGPKCIDFARTVRKGQEDAALAFLTCYEHAEKRRLDELPEDQEETGLDTFSRSPMHEPKLVPLIMAFFKGSVAPTGS